MAYELRISDWRSAVCSSVLKRGSLRGVEVVDATAPCMEGLMKMTWWVLGLIVLAAGGAGMAIQQQADAPAPSQPPFVDPFDPPAPATEHGPWEAYQRAPAAIARGADQLARINADLRSEEHTSELQSLMRISYAVFCLKIKQTHMHTTVSHITYTNLY